LPSSDKALIARHFQISRSDRQSQSRDLCDKAATLLKFSTISFCSELLLAALCFSKSLCCCQGSRDALLRGRQRSSKTDVEHLTIHSERSIMQSSFPFVVALVDFVFSFNVKQSEFYVALRVAQSLASTSRARVILA
jgi:hypothetical protein